MGRLARTLVGAVCLAPSLAFAEYCWMVGCKNEIGYLPMRTAIFGKRQINEGTKATVANYAYLRQQAIEIPQGTLILGPGTVVKVLEVLKTKEGTTFAVVRVLEDQNTRRDECKSTIACTAIFH